MGKRHLFLIDPVERLDAHVDTSSRLAKALVRLNEKCFHAQISGLSWSSGELCTKIICYPWTFLKDTRPEKEIAFLDGFDAIHVRKDPPFDMNYLTMTWMLDSVKKTSIFNRPTALRSFNEKLTIMHFPQYSRQALVSSDVDEIYNFVNKLPEKDAIVKPLNLFAGRGIRRFKLNPDSTQAKKDISQWTANNQSWKIVQKFVKEIAQGEVRVFCAFGKIINWCLKKPVQGNFLANTAAGADLKFYQPSKKEETLIQNYANKLQQHGIDFVGFDLIDGWVSEVNITSPRLLIPKGDHADYYEKIAKLTIDRLSL